MRVFITFLSSILFVECVEYQINQKIDYYEKKIEKAFIRAKCTKIRQDNSDFFKTDTDEVKPEQEENYLDYGSFDFIIVGAGSSGSIIASRLSELKHFDILLLEAGRWDDELTDIPYIYTLFTLTDRNWGYFTTAQKTGCFGYRGNKCIYTQGKVVGGSGTINGLGYTRGNKADYDNWASLGNTGWSFEDVLQYFKKLENFESDDIDLNYRGSGGPINVAYSEVEQNFMNILEAYSEIGVGFTEDYNSESQLGVSRIQRNIKFGRRVSGSTAYVRPSTRNCNLNVTVEALVTKILIEKITRAAYGVQFIKGGKMYTAKARREVIISGGAINSAQLLMLSGIGPEDELKKHNIPVISNLPVGIHLKEHYLFRVSFETESYTNSTPLRELIKEYLEGKGILTNLDNSVSFSYHNTRNSNSSVPNVELVLYLPSPADDLVPSLTNFTDVTQKYINKLDIRKNVYIEIFLLHPESSGTLTLKSANPIDFPRIDIGIFEDSNDLEVFYEAIQIIEHLEKSKIAQVNPLKLIEFQVCNGYNFKSKEYWLCALKHLAAPGLHPSSTTRMGPSGDRLAVVDYKLRVYGIHRLRVADCGIMPTTISGHNNAVAFMIGEKASDWIKQDHQV